ncbi:MULTISPECIES: precorrin-4 C(11)-methyltransferase [unclassified Butyrivibrio]|uniref:precorrin-4 C(11)-methyltransferase n=1 Tax=unclassified Butyrivibrio TaxID=2639466 RepID=UPI000400DB99|nr:MULTISPECIES: precorrin-4 C(11)-methyltransferase [unclassified Butyrivibrio]
MVHFVGAGPGATDLITIRGKKLIEEADVIIYAGSLVNPELLQYAKENAEIHDSARLTLEEVIEIIKTARKENKDVVRLHTGDPSIYGAIREQMDILDEEKITYDVTPGVSSFCGAAAALNMEYTLPGISQSVIITRMDGRTPVPEKESVEALSSHGATMVFFLSAGDLERLSNRLQNAGMAADTPCAIVYKATWDDEKKYVCTLESLAKTAADNGINKTALIIVGKTVAQSGYEKSRLYAADFSTGYREKKL